MKTILAKKKTRHHLRAKPYYCGPEASTHYLLAQEVVCQRIFHICSRIVQHAGASSNWLARENQKVGYSLRAQENNIPSNCDFQKEVYRWLWFSKQWAASVVDNTLSTDIEAKTNGSVQTSSAERIFESTELVCHCIVRQLGPTRPCAKFNDKTRQLSSTVQVSTHLFLVYTVTFSDRPLCSTFSSSNSFLFKNVTITRSVSH